MGNALTAILGTNLRTIYLGSVNSILHSRVVILTAVLALTLTVVQGLLGRS